jgi:hypothetical protein
MARTGTAARAALAPASRRGLALALGAAGATAALALAVYWPSLSDFFFLDDFIWLKAAATHSLVDFYRRELSFSTPLDPFDYPTPYIRPLVDGYFWATWRLFGFDPWAYHAANVAMHVAVSLAVAVLAWQLAGSRLTGFAAGALFAVLPTYDFAVSWVSEATDIICAFFYVASVALFIAFLRARTGRRSLYAASLVAFTLALLAKEPAVTLVAVVTPAALLETREVTRQSLKRNAAEVLPFAALAAAFYLLVYRHEYATVSEGGLYRIDVRVFGHYWDYLRWLTFPFAPGSHDSLRAATAAAFVAGGVLAMARGERAIALAFVWTLVCLLPLSFVVNGIDRRYAYLASAPFALFLALSAQALAQALISDRRLAAMAAAAVVAVALVPLAAEARQRQEFAHRQAAIYRQVYGLAEVCGPLNPGDRIVLIDAPVFDFEGINTQVTVSWRYDHVRVEMVSSGQTALPSSGPGVCVARYEGGRFVPV